MLDLLRQLQHDLDTQRPCAWCRLVETRGSTPQKAGAAMLVYADGKQAGTLGGGCVEAEVKRRALGILESGEPEVTRFQLDHDYGWDDGLVCGGRMEVLIDPLRAGIDAEYFRALISVAVTGAGCTEAIVFDPQKAGRPVPCCFLFDEAGQLIAARSAEDPGAERKVDGKAAIVESLRPLHDRPRPYAENGIAYLPLLPRCRLLIVGGGHVGKAVAELAADLDFEIVVVDDRAEYVSESRFPNVAERRSGNLDECLQSLEVDDRTYCLIVTRGHNHDQRALFHLADRGARYVGMIGSRRKIKLIIENLQDEGIDADALTRVHAPVGIDIGSQTVMEIAVSIVAELVAHRNRGGVVPGRPESLFSASQ